MSDDTFRGLYREAHAHHLNAVAAFVEAYPEGATIAWDRTGGRREGRVINHGYDGRVRVQNGATGAVYWVTMAHVMHAADGEPS